MSEEQLVELTAMIEGSSATGRGRCAPRTGGPAAATRTPAGPPPSAIGTAVVLAAAVRGSASASRVAVLHGVGRAGLLVAVEPEQRLVQVGSGPPVLVTEDAFDGDVVMSWRQVSRFRYVREETSGSPR